MTSQMSKDLFSAILAMDAYNRGYDKNHDYDGESDPEDLWIGSAKVIIDSRILGENLSDVRWDIAAGFYGIAYDTSSVYTFNNDGYDIDSSISYRGTSTSANGVPDELDIYNGWGIALGYADSAQATLAKDFFTIVSGSLTPYETASNTLLTGHSLGGALAGLVGSISGTSALVFDHMPFGAAAFADVANAARALNSGTLPASLSAVGLSAPSMSVVKGIYVEGEALDYLRNDTLAMTLTDLMGSWTGFSTFIGAEGHSSGTTASDIEASIDMTELENYGAYSGLNPLNKVSLHSQSLLVTYLYGRDVAAGSNWQLVAPLFLEKMVDENIAESLGLEQNVTGGSGAGDQLSTVIAY